MALDPRCMVSIEFTRESADLMKMLDPDNLLRTGCRVIKHPDCCILCAANEDCSRLPVHINCRCKPETYLDAEGVGGDFAAA